MPAARDALNARYVDIVERSADRASALQASAALQQYLRQCVNATQWIEEQMVQVCFILLLHSVAPKVTQCGADAASV